MMNGMRRGLTAFEAPGYRWLWGNNVLGTAGFTLEALGQGWLVLQLTDSPLWVGAAAGVRGVAHLLGSIPSGAVADRADRKVMVFGLQAASALKALLVAVLVLTGTIEAWHLLGIAALSGALGAMIQPPTRALEYDIVGPERILNAAALRFFSSGVFTIVSALAGGFVIDQLGVGRNYVVCSGVYLASASCVLLLNPSGVSGRALTPSPFPGKERGKRGREPFLEAVRQGAGYATRTPGVRALLQTSLVVELFGFSYQWMMPVMARDVLHQGATGLGYLAAMGGAGQLVTMMVLASLGDFQNRGRLLIAGILGFGTCILLFGLWPWFPLSLLLAAGMAGMGSVYDSTMSSMLQTTVAGEMRGRVMGLYVSTWGLNQMGGFASGGLATVVGAPTALAAAGGVVAAYALYLARRRPRGSGFRFLEIRD